MHIELIDLLRCPVDHEETWLVAALNAVEDRYVIKAKLGCPVCGASYVIRNKVADLLPATRNQLPADTPAQANPDDAMRVSAFLNLTLPGSLIVLEGRYASLAHTISALTECRVIALNPATTIDDGERVASVLSDTRIPLGTSSVDGAAISDDRLIADASRVLRPSGRLVAPARTILPPGLTEITRDDQQIIAESIGTIVPLRR